MEKLYNKSEVQRMCERFYWMGYGAAKGSPNIDDMADLQPHSIIREKPQAKPAPAPAAQAKPEPEPETSEDDIPAWAPPKTDWRKPTLASNRGAKRIWTKAKVRQEALKYSSRQQFHNGSRNAYNAAIRYGYMNSVCKHMAPPPPHTQKPRRKWTEDAIIKEARKYATRAELLKNDPALYSTIANRKMQSKVFTAYVPPKSVSVLREEDRNMNGPIIEQRTIPNFEDVGGI